MSKAKRFLSADNKFKILVLQLKAFYIRAFSPQLSFFSPGWKKYTNQRNKYGAVYDPPYQGDIYGALLERLSSVENITFSTISDLGITNSRPIVVLRHDLDFTDCVKNLDILTEIEIQHNLRSSIMVRVDCEDYLPEIAKDKIKKHKDKGFDIGLHSTAYTQENPAEALTAELKTFYDVFGFHPTSYNFHGGFDSHLPTRIEMGLAYKEILAQHAYLKTSDSVSGYYEYRLQDCHIRSGSKCIFVDFVSPPTAQIENSRHPILVLTHPCYWKR